MDTLVKEPLQTVHTDHLRVSTAGAERPRAVQVIVRETPATEAVLIALSHHDAAALASRLADDLQLATWEDAEWR